MINGLFQEFVSKFVLKQGGEILGFVVIYWVFRQNIVILGEILCFQVKYWGIKARQDTCLLSLDRCIISSH